MFVGGVGGGIILTVFVPVEGGGSQVLHLNI